MFDYPIVNRHEQNINIKWDTFFQSQDDSKELGPDIEFWYEYNENLTLEIQLWLKVITNSFGH